MVCSLLSDAFVNESTKWCMSFVMTLSIKRPVTPQNTFINAGISALSSRLTYDAALSESMGKAIKEI